MHEIQTKSMVYQNKTDRSKCPHLSILHYSMCQSTLCYTLKASKQTNNQSSVLMAQKNEYILVIENPWTQAQLLRWKDGAS